VVAEVGMEVFEIAPRKVKTGHRRLRGRPENRRRRMVQRLLGLPNTARAGRCGCAGPGAHPRTGIQSLPADAAPTNLSMIAFVHGKLMDACPPGDGGCAGDGLRNF
jgi:hypothetical protein